MLRSFKLLLIIFLIFGTSLSTVSSPTKIWQHPTFGKALQKYLNYKRTSFKSENQILTQLLPLLSVGNWQVFYRFVYNSYGHNVDFILRKKSTCIILEVDISGDIDQIVELAGSHAEGIQNKGICMVTCAVGINIPFDQKYSPIQVHGFGKGCDFYDDVSKMLKDIQSYQQLLAYMKIIVFDIDFQL